MLRHALLILSAALLYTISLPPFGLGLAGFFVATPLTLILLDPSRPLRPLGAWTTGVLFGEIATLAVGGHWLYLAAHDFFGKPPSFSLGFTLLTTLTHAGAFIGAGVALSASFAKLRSPYVRAAAFAATWVALELLRARLFYGCPWNFLGHALAPYPVLLGAATYGGAYALSAACVLVGALVGEAFLASETRTRLRLLGAALAVPAIIYLLQASHVSTDLTAAPTHGAPLTVGLVQPGVGRHDLWNPDKRSHHLAQLLELSRSDELRGTDIIIWPENAVPFLLDADTDAREKIAKLARETGAYVLTGAPRSENRPDGGAAFFNSVYLFPPDGGAHRVYDKVKLLPYIEAAPAFARYFSTRTSGVEYTPGGGRSYFDVRGWKVAPLICFESTYPEIARQAAVDGADLLVNVSNDSWFDRGAAAEQHFGMTVLRAVETRIPLVRVANTGVSAVVEPTGNVTLELPARTSAIARYEIWQAHAPGLATFYVRWGDLFAWACVALAAAGGIAASRSRRDASS
jgi:apolipoprotein N-acyltransferase